MLFHTLPFFILLCVIVPAYYLARTSTLQLLILVCGSFVFYAYDNPILSFLLLFSILVNWFASFGIYRFPDRRIGFAFFGIIANLSLLLFFKYAGLIARTFLPSFSGTVAEIPLPIGISFFTFQGISLIVDTYRLSKSGGNVESIVASHPLNHLLKTSFFKSFFPQLIAGPIVKAHEMYPQIARKLFREIPYEAAFRALVLGYFLKMVIADNLKDQTYWIDVPYCQYYSRLTLIVMLFGYSIQIFADFAGYSLIAIGLGRLLGYELPLNFNVPYIADSFSDFWKRWHISLSTWLRDYLYIPLGGNRRGQFIACVNILIVMGLGGLWHGAAWSYAIWGLYHGALLVLERIIFARVVSAPGFLRILRVSVVFIAVSMGWLLFRLPNFEHVRIFSRSVLGNSNMPHNYSIILLVLLYSLPVVIYHLVHLLRGEAGVAFLKKGESWIYGAMLFMIVFNAGPPGKFIYFQF